MTFVEESSARACAATRHELHGKFVDCKQAQPGPNEGSAQPPPLPSVPPAGGGLGGHYGPPARHQAAAHDAGTFIAELIAAGANASLTTHQMRRSNLRPR